MKKRELKRTGNKKTCIIAGCSQKQDAYIECRLCEKHSLVCPCDFHVKKKQRTLKRRNLLLKAHWKEHGPPPPKSVKISASQNEKQAENDVRSDDDSRDNYQEVDDNPFGSGGCIGLQEELDADGAQYLHMVETKWTPIGANCVVFPNFKIRNEAVELKDTDFIHVYQLRYNPVSSELQAERNHDCEESLRLSHIFAGGFDTNGTSFEEACRFFEIKSTCVHSK
jgi:hypothetical protein